MIRCASISQFTSESSHPVETNLVFEGKSDEVEVGQGDEDDGEDNATDD